jgi:hypothetical protein
MPPYAKTPERQEAIDPRAEKREEQADEEIVARHILFVLH